MQEAIKENPGLLLVSLLILTVFLYFPTAISFYSIWTSEANPAYSHGILLLGVSIYLIVRIWRRHRPEIRFDVSMTGIAAVTVLSLVWFLAYLGNIQLVQLFSLLFIIGFVFVALLGARRAKIFLFPLVLIIFAVPTWGFLNNYLRLAAVKSVEILLDITGILNNIDGFVIKIPEGAFLVDVGCSGLGQLITALSISFIYSFIYPFRWSVRFILIISAAVTAVISNILRVYIIILSGHLTNMQHYFVTVEHVSLGWGVFAVCMFIYFILAAKYLNPLPKSLLDDEQSTIVNTSEEGRSELNYTVFYTAVVMLLVAISCGPALAYHYSHQEGKIVHTGRDLPPQFGNWRSTDSTSELRPDIRGADEHEYKSYKNLSDNVVELNVFRYNVQHQGKEAINDLNSIYQKSTWNLISTQSNEEFVSDRVQEIEATIIESPDGGKKMIWKWYEVNGLWTSNTMKTRLLNILGILIHKPAISIFIASTDLIQSEESSNRILRQFTTALRKAYAEKQPG